MRISMNLQDNSYDVVIEKGMMKKIGSYLREIWSPQKIVLITDCHVNRLYGQQLAASLTGSGFNVSIFDFPAGEASKSLTTAEAAWEFCAKSALTRSDGIVALGGGVVGDLAAFVASTYMRGVHFAQVPTSLTAQVDSSVGGKTGINSRFAKNMVGTFSHPDAVFIDPDFLTTLDERCLHEGMGEIIKCALIADKVLWEKLEKMSGNDILENADFLIERALRVKIDAVLEDQWDNGSRLSLNFGHTLGHAIEATTDFGEFMHGEAVAIGMIELSSVAEKKGLIADGLTEKIQVMIKKFGLPTEVELDEELLFEALTHDKKARGNEILLILVPEIGSYQIHRISIQEMRDYCHLNHKERRKI